MKKVLVFASFVSWPIHFETDLELARTAAEEGAEVTLFTCDASLPTCQSNVSHRYLTCRMCQAKIDVGMKWLARASSVTRHPGIRLSEAEEKSIAEIASQRFASVEAVKALSYDGCDIGMAAMSSVISHIREPNPDIEQHRELIQNNIASAMRVYFMISRLLRDETYSRVIVFNGRFSTHRPVLRVARKMGVEVLVHERGTYANEYAVTYNTYPHDLNYVAQQLLEIKRTVPAEEQERVGRAWFEERRLGEEQNWRSFIANQTRHKLPPEINSSKLKIAIFNSSEDEFQAIEEWTNPYYESQNEGIRKILEECAGREILFFLRVHPNLGGIVNSQTGELDRIRERYDNLVYIGPESDVSTYDLIREVDLVIVFGSTVGIEAAFMGKTVFLMGNTPYRVLEACVKPKDHGHLLALIDEHLNGTEQTAATENDALVYGYWQKTRGTPFRFVEQTSVKDAFLLDGEKRVALKDSLPYRFYALPYRTIDFVRKNLGTYFSQTGGRG